MTDFTDGERELAQWLEDYWCRSEDAEDMSWLLLARELQKKICDVIDLCMDDYKKYTVVLSGDEFPNRDDVVALIEDMRKNLKSHFLKGEDK